MKKKRLSPTSYDSDYIYCYEGFLGLRVRAGVHLDCDEKKPVHGMTIEIATGAGGAIDYLDEEGVRELRDALTKWLDTPRPPAALPAPPVREEPPPGLSLLDRLTWRPSGGNK